MVDVAHRSFWRDAIAWKGSATPKVLPDVCVFGVIAAGICLAAWLSERWAGVRLGIAIAPHELVGAALGLLLILRTNAGYDRWWEARKLWGGIVNQSRNLAISGLKYGPADEEWRAQFIRWTAAFPHAARCFLRNQSPAIALEPLIGPAAAQRIAAADHAPCAVAAHLAGLLNAACQQGGLNHWAFLQIDKERAQLIDHLGGCERILKSPLPLVYCIKIRRFLAIFLVSLPFALLHRMHWESLVPLVTMLVAYSLLALDRIGSELQNPFSERNLSHLPLTDITATIERNVTALRTAEGDLPMPELSRKEPAFAGGD